MTTQDPAGPESAMPRTEAGKALLRKRGWAINAEVIAAIEEQAATEARRELLAKVEEPLTDLHRWDERRGWARFNAILARLDAALAGEDPDIEDPSR